MRWWAVVQRNLLVWRRLFWPSLVGNLAEPLLVLVAFGYGVGGLVGTISVPSLAAAGLPADIPYIAFLASGSIVMSTMVSASFESLYSAYSRMGPQRTWDGILQAPISLSEIVFAEMVWAGLKSFFTASAILLVMTALGLVQSPLALMALPILFVVGLCFASIGLIFTALARGYDFFTYFTTLLMTPMTFISGVYFPMEQLPVWLQGVASALPLSAGVELVRPLFFGLWPEDFLLRLGQLLLTGAIAYAIALSLLKRRFQA